MADESDLSTVPRSESYSEAQTQSHSAEPTPTDTLVPVNASRRKVARVPPMCDVSGRVVIFGLFSMWTQLPA